MAEQLVCGIDIGSTKIATIVALQGEDNTFRVIGFNTTPSRGVKKGVIVDIDHVISGLELSVEKAERMAGHRIKEAYVSIGGPHISSMNSHGIVAVANPQFEVIEDDVRRVIEAARAISLSNTRQVIDVAPREYCVDGQGGINNPVGMSGVRLEVDTHIITASTTVLKNIEKVLNNLGIKNSGFVFAGVASAEAVITETERDLGVAVVDIGGGKMDMSIFIEGSLSYSASIAIGARHISNDIAVGLRVSLDSAEKIKVFLSNNAKQTYAAIKEKDNQFLKNAQLNIPEKLPDVTIKELVDGIIGPRVEEIYAYLKEEIVKSGYEKQIPSGIVLTGGGSQTIGIIEMGRRIMRLPIRIGVPEKVAGLVDEVSNPQYATTLGLIYYSSILSQEDSKSLKNFNHILKKVSIGDIMSNARSFLKQFLPN